MEYKNVNKILLIKLRGIGDVVLSTIVIDNLKDQFPAAKIDFLTEGASIPALEGLPQINSVLRFNRKSTTDRIKLFFKVRRQKYDMVIDMFANPSSAQLTYFSGARYRIGFPYDGRKYGYNIFGPEERDKYHNADLHLKLLEHAGISAQKSALYFHYDDSDKAFVKQYFIANNLTDKFVVTLSPSGGWQSKRIDPNVFAKIGDYLSDKLNCSIAIIWGPGDKEDAEDIHKLMNAKSFLAPPTTLRQMGAFLANSDIVIANCSGPMHISVAVGSATLSIHGPTIPWLQGAYGAKNETLRNESLDCIGCNLLECNRNHECFNELSMDLVLEKVNSLIKKNNLQLK